MNRHPRLEKSRRSGKRGAALVIVLLLLAIVSILLSEFLYEQRINTTLIHNRQEKLKARFVARAGQNAAVGLIMHEAPDRERTFNNEFLQLFRYTCFSPPMFASLGLTSDQEQEQEQELTDISTMQGCGLWSLTIPYVLVDTPIDLEIFDEQSRLNLNALLTRVAAKSGDQAGDEELSYQNNNNMVRILYELFHYQAVRHEIEISDYDLKYMIDPLLIDYIDHGAIDGSFDRDEMSYFEYEDSDKVTPMKNAWLDTVDEIRLLPGMTDKLFDAVKDFLTVYPVDAKGNFIYQVNTSAAPMEVLYALIRGTSYQNDEPTMTEEEALNMAMEMIQTAYNGGTTTGQSTSTSAQTPALPRYDRTQPKNLLTNAIFQSFVMNKNQSPRFYRVVSTALAEEGLQTAITKVQRFQSANITTLYYRED